MSADSVPRTFIRCLDSAVRQAASLVRRLEGRVENRPKLGEETAVKRAMTDADAAAQEVILQVLLDDFPEVALAAEEDTPLAKRFPREGRRVVVIDPIDGTLHSYLEGAGPYAVIVGLAIEGLLAASFVALPREGLFFAASKGDGAQMARGTGPYRPAHVGSDGKRLLASHGLPKSMAAALTDSGFELVPSCGGAVSVAPLITGVVAGVRHAPGGLGISIRGRVGTLIAAEAGATVRGADGSAFPLDLTTPADTLIVATDERHADQLSDALAAAKPG